MMEEKNTTHGHQPTPREIVMLEMPNAARVSPDGKRVAYGLRTTNWREDCYETLCLLHNRATNERLQLTRSGDVSQMEWVDDQTLALLQADAGSEGKAQVHVYEGAGGAGWAVTSHSTSVEWFAPFADGFLFLARRPDDEAQKVRAGQFGKFVHFEQETSQSALYYVGLAQMREHLSRCKAATDEEAKAFTAPVIELSRLLPERLSIRQVIPAPSGDAVYLNCWPRDDLVYARETTSFRIEVDAQAALAEFVERSAGPKDGMVQPENFSYLGQITRLNLPLGAGITAVSPDDQQLLVGHRERDQKMYTRRDIWRVRLDDLLTAGGADAMLARMVNLTAGLDRELHGVYWRESGIYGLYADGVRMRVARIDKTGDTSPVDLGDLHPADAFHVGLGGHLAFAGTNADTFPEVFVADRADEGWSVECLTELGRAVDGWEMGTVETIRWTSVDGTEIEGVLRKPANFDPNRKYPLVFVVHGGPQGISPAYLLSREDIAYYPTLQFAHKDVLVVKPNYRGSTGYGQAFEELNVNNLGVGDLWDVESALDYLDGQGCVDTERVGCMGWSQGGYISAFAGLHSERFQAVSVGAGISDWYTYHISNDTAIPGG
jgi:dipeptidyl aminopeptidase/acylaminoacyl peptidase